MEHPEKIKVRTHFWHYPHYSNQGGKSGAVIRQGNYKLIYFFEEDKIELSDVINAIGATKKTSPPHTKRWHKDEGKVV